MQGQGPGQSLSNLTLFYFFQFVYYVQGSKTRPDLARALWALVLDAQAWPSLGNIANMLKIGKLNRLGQIWTLALDAQARPGLGNI